jgi:hypothetical protein
MALSALFKFAFPFFQKFLSERWFRWQKATSRLDRVFYRRDEIDDATILHYLYFRARFDMVSLSYLGWDNNLAFG